MLMRQNVNKDVILKSAYWEWIECILDLPLLKVVFTVDSTVRYCFTLSSPS